jgi:hypothetical protein
VRHTREHAQSTSFAKRRRKKKSRGWLSDHAIRNRFFEIASPSLIFRPSFTGFDPGSLLRKHSSLSRD